MLTGKPLVSEEKATDDKTMLSWLIAMSGAHTMPTLSRQSDLGAECFDENGTRILHPSFEIAYFMYRVVHTWNTRGNTGTPDYFKWSRSSR